jgi:hypothetical protein
MLIRKDLGRSAGLCARLGALLRYDSTHPAADVKPLRPVNCQSRVSVGKQRSDEPEIIAKIVRRNRRRKCNQFGSQRLPVSALHSKRLRRIAWKKQSKARLFLDDDIHCVAKQWRRCMHPDEYDEKAGREEHAVSVMVRHFWNGEREETSGRAVKFLAEQVRAVEKLGESGFRTEIAVLFQVR